VPTPRCSNQPPLKKEITATNAITLHRCFILSSTAAE
jgi:hypothetical protein